VSLAVDIHSSAILIIGSNYPHLDERITREACRNSISAPSYSSAKFSAINRWKSVQYCSLFLLGFRDNPPLCLGVRGAILVRIGELMRLARELPKNRRRAEVLVSYCGSPVPSAGTLKH
jgi:hypothetical protein